MRTPIPRRTSSGIPATTLPKFSGPRMASLTLWRGAVERDLHVDGQARERLQRGQPSAVEQRPVGEHDHGENSCQPGEQVGHPVEQEGLAAGDAEAGEAEVARLCGARDDRLGIKHAPGDAGR